MAFVQNKLDKRVKLRPDEYNESPYDTVCATYIVPMDQCAPLQKMVTCPFNSAHQLKYSKLPRHILKCREQTPDHNMVPCINNALEYIRKDEVEAHMEVCQYRVHNYDEFVRCIKKNIYSLNDTEDSSTETNSDYSYVQGEDGPLPRYDYDIENKCGDQELYQMSQLSVVGQNEILTESKKGTNAKTRSHEDILNPVLNEDDAVDRYKIIPWERNESNSFKSSGRGRGDMVKQILLHRGIPTNGNDEPTYNQPTRGRGDLIRKRFGYNNVTRILTSERKASNKLSSDDISGGYNKKDTRNKSGRNYTDYTNEHRVDAGRNYNVSPNGTDIGTFKDSGRNYRDNTNDHRVDGGRKYNENGTTSNTRQAGGGNYNMMHKKDQTISQRACGRGDFMRQKMLQYCNNNMMSGQVNYSISGWGRGVLSAANDQPIKQSMFFQPRICNNQFNSSCSSDDDDDDGEMNRRNQRQCNKNQYNGKPTSHKYV